MFSDDVMFVEIPDGFRCKRIKNSVEGLLCYAIKPIGRKSHASVTIDIAVPKWEDVLRDNVSGILHPEVYDAETLNGSKSVLVRSHFRHDDVEVLLGDSTEDEFWWRRLRVVDKCLVFVEVADEGEASSGIQRWLSMLESLRIRLCKA